jgi:rSAM/selenodomain-associated transferase 1
MPNRLILFARNLLVGKVKTRIASKIGDELALEVYRILFNNTIQIIASLPSTIKPVIYYSDFVENENNLGFEGIRTEVQEGSGLGERMANSLEKEFGSGARKVCIIGTDIYSLNAQIIENAFNRIHDNNVIIGPATDGGYYLLGTNNYNTKLFSDISWSKSTVLKDTIKNINNLGLNYELLKFLSDVDEYEDIPKDIIAKLNLE